MISFSLHTTSSINHQTSKTLEHHGGNLDWTVHIRQTCSAWSQVCVWCSWRYYPHPICRSFITRLTALDYELVILDMIPAAGLTWRGNANELIASYAVCPPPKGFYYLLTCAFKGRWLRTRERYRCFRHYIRTWRAICLLRHGWSICRIRESSTLYISSESLRCTGPGCTYRGISIHIRHEEPCYYAS